jgi:hypothetical protein
VLGSWLDTDGPPCWNIRTFGTRDREILEGRLTFPEGTPPEEMPPGIEKRLRREGLSEEAEKEATKEAAAGAVIVS